VITCSKPDGSESAVAILVNAHDHKADMRLSRSERKRDWRVAFCSARKEPKMTDARKVTLPAQSIALLVSG
jgi:hypothetical protein